ncbi:TRAP transporter substrate-binding protein [Parvularcula sp. ZS-1/3]|uniref:TRAP transporter substrate-binding protein n=1 Tax=Parvularcula mediterranea TaxID=2732508 RepID=A0A7Y3RJM4_9PROT|nr:TRAP transporter substrate-binding protein [Parvularcula mediterranea]NNU15289.1 TRAP transporter substrate-binding protein [Parvularcula mediterranea]
MADKARRGFLKTAALAAPLALAACDCAERCAAVAPAQAAAGIEPRRLKMVTTWPKDFPGLGDSAERTAAFVGMLSGGAIQIEVFAAGELVGAFDSFDAVASGAADLYHGADYYWTSKSRAYPYFTAVPFGMTVTEQIGWLEAGGGQELWDRLAAPFGIKPFAAGNTGHQLGGWFKNELTDVDGLRGLKIRMPGIGGEVMRRAGASPVLLPGSELYQSLQSGAISATEWVGPWNDLAMGFYREAKYYMWPGFHEPNAQLSMGMNLDLWNSFSAQEQAIFNAAARSANHELIGTYVIRNADALRVLTEEHGAELTPMPEDVMALLAEKTTEVLEEIADSSPIAREIHDSYMATLRDTMKLTAITDAAYIDLRQRLIGG